ncbi:LexA family transcriptional regulator [Sinomicrobium soli]|uniref:LexA family transcriptional regulator n=1 Tax=Sinomicrobium sp. N-1-3-6 TaxID=2219864 RepID=UPI000DCEFB79|nr:helix-turn-helix domain-containing protein [Sinomicrobium sp. N-1-3-6]RAV29667.1 hypothetical protein DN748_05990 [Sinomicrobium sp. N-1-3-6]
MKNVSAIGGHEDDDVLFEVTEVIDRLKKRLNIRTNAALSDILNVRPNTISTWKKRNTMDFHRVFSLCKTHDIDINDLFFDQGDKKDPVREKDAGQGFRVVSRESSFQYVMELHRKSFIENLPRFDFPFIHGNNIRAFQMIGSSMAPILQDGDFAVGEYLGTDISGLTDGNTYVLVSNLKGIYISRIIKDPSYPDQLILIMNGKPGKERPEVKMHSKEILEIWEVTSVFSLDLVGHRMNKNPGI